MQSTPLLGGVRAKGPQGAATRPVAASERQNGPQPLRGAGLLLAVPGLAQQFSPVPGAYHGHLGDGERVVTCVCGRRPVLSRGELRGCERAREWVPTKTAGVCPRTFVATNHGILVFGGPR